MRKVIAIKDMFGKELPIEKMEFTFVGKNYAYGHYKGYGTCFAKVYGEADGYTVITEEK